MPIEVPTHAELMQVGEDAALLRTSKLDVGSFAPGFIPDVFLGLTAALAEETIQRAIALHNDTFIDTAAGDALDALALDHFDLTRQAAVKAIGDITFDRLSAAFGDVVIASGQLVETSDGTQFAVDAPVTLTGLSVAATVTAVVGGEAGIVAIAAINTIDPALPDSSITVTNAARTTGGQDAETDVAFRTRIKGYLATVRRATLAAVKFGAEQTPGVVQANVEEQALVVQSVDGSIHSDTEGAEVDGGYFPKGSYEFVRIVISYVAVLADSETLTISANLQDATDAVGSGEADFGAEITAVVAETAPGAGGPHTIYGSTTLLVDVTGSEAFLRLQATCTTSAAGTLDWAGLLEWQQVLARVNAYITDAAGGASSALLTAVEAELENWRAAGVVVAVAAAAVVTQTVDLTVAFAAGFDTSDTRDAIKAAVIALVNGLDVGETLFASKIVAAASIAGVNNVVVSDPAGDVVPTAQQVIRTATDGTDITFL